MDFSLQHHSSFNGSHVSELPTPALTIRKQVLEDNIARLHKDVDDLNIAFRPHIKTLKTLEATRMLLGKRHKKIVASTVAEIRGALPLVGEGLLEEVLYGLPINRTALNQLTDTRKSVRIALLVDHEQHIDLLEELAEQQPWDVFIKLDVGSKRAGVPTESSRLPSLVQRVLDSKAASLSGFYCHAGHSYGCKTAESAEELLGVEVEAVLKAATLVPSNHPLVVSVGATPTAHVVSKMRAAAPSNVILELHAGNFPANDLQQLSTGLISESDLAVRVLAEVCSVYPERNEVLVNAGTIALSKETSAFPGFGNIVGKPSWYISRMSQEHGILSVKEGGDGNAAEEFRVGDKVSILCVHSCITAAAFHAFYLVDKNDVVRETWVPWKAQVDHFPMRLMGQKGQVYEYIWDESLAPWPSDSRGGKGGIREPEHRLWVLLVPGLLSTGGLLLWGVGASRGINFMGLIVGIFFVSFGVVTSGAVVLAYTVDCSKEITGESLITVIIIRNTIGFAFNFSINPWIDGMGLQNHFIFVGMLALLTTMSFLVMLKRGKSLRRMSSKKYWEYM